MPDATTRRVSGEEDGGEAARYQSRCQVCPRYLSRFVCLCHKLTVNFGSFFWCKIYSQFWCSIQFNEMCIRIRIVAIIHNILQDNAALLLLRWVVVVLVVLDHSKDKEEHHAANKFNLIIEFEQQGGVEGRWKETSEGSTTCFCVQ